MYLTHYYWYFPPDPHDIRLSPRSVASLRQAMALCARVASLRVLQLRRMRANGRKGPRGLGAAGPHAAQD